MISPSLWPTAVLTVARTFGVRGTVLRVTHELRRNLGLFRERPRYEFGDGGIQPLAAFVVSPDALASASDYAKARCRADRVFSGQYEAYRWDWRELPDNAEAWRTNRRTHYRYSAREPWWRITHLSRDFGDIKDVWEPARFGWLYDLIRGYLLTDDPAYARSAFDRVAAWAESSPAFRGVHWSCGQETAIRAIALVYAEANLSAAPGVREEDRRLVRDLLAASGERIADAIGYAISQRNNHAISEAAGLVVLGTRFLGAHPEAERWLRRGRRWLERVVLEQFAEDGWYIQHSFGYLRVALDQCIVAERALRYRGKGLSPPTVARLRAAARLLLRVVDGNSGFVPNHGANDGAFVHPITLAEYRDFRPVITATAAVFGEPLPTDVSADREVLAWIGEADCPSSTPRADEVCSGASGWAAARVGNSSVFLRAGRYRSRPSHVDALHVDIRLHGREVIVDPGTFSYNSPPPWANALVSGRVHNGPLLDRVEPGVRGPRFLWLAWPRAQLRTARLDGDVALLVADIPGRLRRTVRVGKSEVEVEDEVLAGKGHSLSVVWLLHPDASPADITSSPAARILRATEADSLGWFSPRYGERLPSRAIFSESGAANIHTRITCGPAVPGVLPYCEIPARNVGGIIHKR